MTRAYRKTSEIKPYLLARLRASVSQFVHADDLIVAAYYDNDIGEPEVASSAIWRVIQGLRKDGLKIEGRQNVGYRLISEGVTA